MEHPFLYLFVFLGLLGLVCAVVRVLYLRFGSIDDRSTYGDDSWRDQ